MSGPLGGGFFDSHCSYTRNLRSVREALVIWRQYAGQIDEQLVTYV